MNISQLFRHSADKYRAKPFLRYRDGDIAFETVSQTVARLTGGFIARGVKPGSRIMLLARNKPEWLATLFAGLNAGALVIPVNPALTSNEVGNIVEQAHPEIVVADADLVAVLPANMKGIEILAIGDGTSDSWQKAVEEATATDTVLDVPDEQPALMFYTSGTTGRPKGALLSHGAEIFTAKMVAKHFRLAPTDISMISSSLSFIYPLVIDCLASIHAGATVVLQERFHPEFCLRGMEKEKATIFMGVPTMFGMMLDWAQDKDVGVSSLRFCVSAGQNLSWSVASRFKQRFGPPVYDLWGQTEGTPITSYDPSRDAEGRSESCGRALPECAVRVIDDSGRDVPPETVGEVLLTGPNIFLGYDGNPQATAETLRDGWVYTGDLGKLDGEGFLYIVGRKRDMVIRGGANIYPAEVEEVIYAHPAVAECAVIGVPDEVYGESVKAFVVEAAGQHVTAEALTEHCRVRLASYKVPSQFEFIPVLPKGPTGKILKRELREQASKNIIRM